MAEKKDVKGRFQLLPIEDKEEMGALGGSAGPKGKRR